MYVSPKADRPRKSYSDTRTHASVYSVRRFASGGRQGRRRLCGWILLERYPVDCVYAETSKSPQELFKSHKTNADYQVLPHHVAHHISDHNPSKKVHVKSPIPGRIIDPLRRLMPELWEEGEAFDTHLFGCPDCDIMGQVSRNIISER